MEEKRIESVEAVEETPLQVTIETKIRTALFFVAWVNEIFAFVGAPTLDLDFDAVYGVVSSFAAFGISIWAWWKNNSFTQPALIGDIAMNQARHAKDDDIEGYMG